MTITIDLRSHDNVHWTAQTPDFIRLEIEEEKIKEYQEMVAFLEEKNLDMCKGIHEDCVPYTRVEEDEINRNDLIEINVEGEAYKCLEMSYYQEDYEIYSAYILITRYGGIQFGFDLMDVPEGIWTTTLYLDELMEYSRDSN